MGQPAAKQGDRVVAVDTHIVMVPGPPAPPVPTPLPHPFAGMLSGGLSTDVKISGKPAATVSSTADNAPPHVPTAPGTTFTVTPLGIAMGFLPIRDISDSRYSRVRVSVARSNGAASAGR